MTKLKEPKSNSPQKHRAKQSLTSALVEILCFAGLLFAVVALVYIDTVILNNNLSEQSITEYASNLSLVLSSAVFAAGAIRAPSKRGYLACASTLFFLMFIREKDDLFDQIIHGFWKYPASIVLLVGALIGAWHRNTIVKPFLDHFASRSFSYVVSGFLLVVIFSRLMGSGYLWREVLADEYNPVVKAIVQESIELLGYAFMLFGARLSFLHGFSDNQTNSQS